jgi:triosephosphate isomerase
MPRRLVVGNWKMNGSKASNAGLLEGLTASAASRGQAGRAMVVCVPFPYLQQACDALAGRGVGWGAQDVSAHRQGAFTGEVAAAMLREFGCSHVIVGHSERRQYHGESNDLVGQKAAVVLEHGMTPIVCVGETLAEREAERTEEVVAGQLAAVLQRLGADIGRAVVAYEPVWAIGTGRTATPEQAQAVHAILRQRLREVQEGGADVPILYGGSVKADNAASLFACADIDGGLVGGASLNAQEFSAICAA